MTPSNPRLESQTVVPANSLGTINLTTGAVGAVAVSGPLTPKGLVFVP